MDLISLQSSWEDLTEIFSDYNMSEKDLLFLKKRILEKGFQNDILVLNTILPGECYSFIDNSKIKTIIIIGENGKRIIPKSAFDGVSKISTIGSEQYPITKIEEHGFFNNGGNNTPMEIFLDPDMGATLKWSALDIYGSITIHGQIKYMDRTCLGRQSVTFVDKQTKLEYIGKEVFGGTLGYRGPANKYFYIPNTIQIIKEKALISALETIEFASTDLTNVTIEDMNAFPLTNTNFKFIVPQGAISTYITKFNSITDSKGTWTALSPAEKEALFEEASAE